jgi:hypothetical protein
MVAGMRTPPRTIVLGIVVGLALVHRRAAAAAADAKEMKQIARIAVADGVLHEAIAFADGGAKLAYAETDGQGKTRLHVGPPGGKATTTDITAFTPAPEKILFVGGYWFVIANEGDRRAAVIGPSGRIENQIGAFGDCFLSNVRGPTFVTVTDKGASAKGHAYSIAAYRPTGALVGSKVLTIGGDGTLAGTEGLTFVAFTGGYLQALVKKAGSYNAKADLRGGTQIAVLDVLTGKVGPGRNLPNIPAFMHFAEKRAEKPGLEAFLRANDDANGLELVGPGEKQRPLALPSKWALYETGSLQQQASTMAAGKLFFSLTVDPLNPDQVAAQKKGARVLHLFEAGVNDAKATLLGRVPLGETQSYAWAAGGNKLAVIKRTQASGGNEILIFSR